MLVNGLRLLGVPVMSLHVGGEIARTTGVIVNPDNLKIVALTLDNLAGDGSGDILETVDVREFSNLGMIVDSSDVFVTRGDVVRLDKIIDLGFNPIGFKVVSRSGSRLGKVEEFIVDTKSFRIMQFVVKRPVLKAFLDPELMIGRGEIVEINNSAIVVKDEKEKPKAARKTEVPAAEQPDFVNPFRKPATQEAFDSRDTFRDKGPKE